MVVDRREMRDAIIKLLNFMMSDCVTRKPTRL